MRVYLDNCAIQRPLDDKSNLRNRIEAEAVMGLFELIENGKLVLVNSEVLIFELNNTPDPERVEFGNRVLALCKETIRLTDEITKRALEFEKAGVGPIDALHLSAAIENNIKYLCTCDDKFLRKANKIKNTITKVVLPTELIKEVVK